MLTFWYSGTSNLCRRETNTSYDFSFNLRGFNLLLDICPFSLIDTENGISAGLLKEKCICYE